MEDLQTVHKARAKTAPHYMKQAIKKILCLAICLSMTTQSVPASAAQAVLPQDTAAVTFAQLNASEVFLKQSQSRVCTLTASTMMIRRAAMLSGSQDWRQITEQYVRKYAWAEKTGLKWNFTAAGITVAQKTLSSKNELIQMLGEHPEGVVIYNTAKPHAILVTDYTNGVLYCSDPSNDKPGGRYPIAQASITVESAGRCWYVKNPVGLTVVHTAADDMLDASSGLEQAGTELDSDRMTGSEEIDANAAPDTGSLPAADSSGDGELSDSGTEDNQESFVSDSDSGQDSQTASDPLSNTNYKVGNLMYRILDKKAGTAACTGRAKNVTAVTIPETVQVQGVSYRVVQVAPGAFAEALDMKEIKVGANVAQIGEKAFYRCKKLQKITLYAQNLQTIGKDAFAKIHKKVKLLMIGEQMEKFAKLLSGTSVPLTATVKVQADNSSKAAAKRV